MTLIAVAFHTGARDRDGWAIAVLERAQALSSARSSSAFARRLAEVAGGSPSVSTYLRWLTGRTTVPAWALLAAAQAAGTTLGELLAPPLGQAEIIARLTEMEQAIARLHTNAVPPPSEAWS